MTATRSLKIPVSFPLPSHINIDLFQEGRTDIPFREGPADAQRDRVWNYIRAIHLVEGALGQIPHIYHLDDDGKKAVESYLQSLKTTKLDYLKLLRQYKLVDDLRKRMVDYVEKREWLESPNRPEGTLVGPITGDEQTQLVNNTIEFVQSQLRDLKDNVKLRLYGTKTMTSNKPTRVMIINTQRQFRKDRHHFRDDHHQVHDGNHQFRDEKHRFRDDEYQVRDNRRPGSQAASLPQFINAFSCWLCSQLLVCPDPPVAVAGVVCLPVVALENPCPCSILSFRFLRPANPFAGLSACMPVRIDKWMDG
ncbi:hypothetical protein VTJ04DRAFT_7396 [Mycothermus thermophilus]|uniref:uncharacterized protein n=1 Tax=Humicola insolens TaxID=85995 RepID=UPI00374296F2